MTATFGKLEHETLTLKPGLNIIEAPNEWGKTTWCAFLLAMLYGLDTRAKSTKTTLADKERYAPWSSSPMAGRIDLNWKGRDITIERSTRGRTPMGVFRAYETQSGLAVPELTAANCGQQLLGVEQSVFRRTGFIRQSDMPVTQDETLRRRLNDLVTTGDETGDGERLAKELKELKNKCRHNRTGLLPQAEEMRDALEGKLQELESLRLHSRKLKERLGEVQSWQQALENHSAALRFAAAEADACRVAEARDQRDRAERQVAALEEVCEKLPSREEVERKLHALQTYREDLAAYQLEEEKLPEKPSAPIPPEQFRGMTPEQAGNMVGSDYRRYEQLSRTKPYLVWILLGWAFLLACIPVMVAKQFVVAGIGFALGMVFLVLGIRKMKVWAREAEVLRKKYGTENPDAWRLMFQTYVKEKKAFDQAVLEYRVTRGDLDIQNTFLQKQRESLCGSQTPEKVQEIWQQMLQCWDNYQLACREYQQAEKYLRTLQDMAKTTAEKPAQEDHLDYSQARTDSLLAQAQAEQQHLLSRLGQYQGRMEALGDSAALQAELQAVEQRISRLEETYCAVSIALDTLSQARQELQRRFAPRIAKRAQTLLAAMTGGRYDRLSLGEDLSLLAGAQQEDTLHEALWRSDGTVDQLYLSLRLAVAEDLTPEAPLILDDAFVRFDDVRLAAALEILKEEAERKQVILFTCQHREKEYCGECGASDTCF